MVAVKAIRSSNASLTARSSGMVALFVGATSGCCMGTLKQFAKLAKAPKVYIVGRSKSSATPLLEELRSVNSQATFVFLETQISLIRNVDKICSEIKSKEKKMDLIVMVKDFYDLETDEGIDTLASVSYYARVRTVYNLLPLLNASSSPRVISVLAGGQEAPIDLTDLEVTRKYSLIKLASATTTQNLFAFEELAKANPSISFAHFYPGLVNTGTLYRFLQTAPGLWALACVAGAASPDGIGEVILFIATSARYPPAEPKGEGFMVPTPKAVGVAMSSYETDGKGSGVYRLGANAESAPNTSALADFRGKAAGKTIWESTQSVWERALKKAT